MVRDKFKHYKEMLISERNKLDRLIKDMKKNEISDMYEEMADEISVYFDNHPGDVGSIRSDRSRKGSLSEGQCS